jgi:hypothetical protein
LQTHDRPRSLRSRLGGLQIGIHLKARITHQRLLPKERLSVMRGMARPRVSERRSGLERQQQFLEPFEGGGEALLHAHADDLF